jgi:integrase/recombinase XerD
MAHPKARLYQRLRSKGFPWVLVEFHKNGSPKPHADAFQFGVRYSLKGKRKLDPAATLDEAQVILKDRNVHLYAQQNGVALPEAAGKRSDSRTVIADAVTEYLTTGKAYEKKWSEDTLRCYRDSTGLLLRYCLVEGVEYIQDIDKKVVLRFKPFLRESKDRYGFPISDRTVFNHFLNAVSFLNEYKVDHGLKESDWPTFEEKEVSVYSDSEFNTLLAAANVEERDVLEFFFGVNFRNGEGAHTEWHDIDFDQKEVSIYSKEQKYDWRVKDKEKRIVPVSDALVERLGDRRRRHPDDILVFQNRNGRPDVHLLRIIKRVALRAGLNCGHCVAKTKGKHPCKHPACKEGLSCRHHPVCKKWIIHTLRKTWATNRSRAGMDVETLRDFLGHSSLATTQRYLKAAKRSDPKTREQINAADRVLSAKAALKVVA